MTRATPMPPQERRASLVEATLPLLLQHGPSLTTKQVAEAAGVAEGTIFRAFTSLPDLIAATTREALSAQRLQRDIAAVEPGDTLLSKSHAAIAILTQRMADVRNLLHTVHHSQESDGGACLRDELEARRDELEAWLLGQLEPHVDELSIEPQAYVEFLRTIALGHVFNYTHGSAALTPETLASLALSGARKAN
ncbi:TetR/AcrR family transcriptional regulator [Tessaracoccus sp. ZS01]|uniref:TetR/AcrR family transcriptional regulator n=1 Tax=Tessaracoccus sp. ZS01 TaxID=1906324 RepID=UPI00117F76FD|nr:TetR/AcrR family transcriptional regulator [Tessaracoccus sp. ZS01]